MSFHKRHVPSVEVLKEQLKEMGMNSFLDRYTKPDALIGSQESLDFIDDILEDCKEMISIAKQHNSTTVD
jgi:hypothetical protein